MRLSELTGILYPEIMQRVPHRIMRLYDVWWQQEPPLWKQVGAVITKDISLIQPRIFHTEPDCSPDEQVDRMQQDIEASLGPDT